MGLCAIKEVLMGIHNGQVSVSLLVELKGDRKDVLEEPVTVVLLAAGLKVTQ